MLIVLKHQHVESAACKDGSPMLNGDSLRPPVATTELPGQICPQENLLQGAGLADSLQPQRLRT